MLKRAQKDLPKTRKASEAMERLILDQAKPKRSRRAAAQYGLMEDERDPHDNYETPESAVHQLLSHVKLQGDIWDPSCGRGMIVKALIEGGRPMTMVHASDKYIWKPIKDAVMPRLHYGVDFLKTDQMFAESSNIVMNPPFKESDPHVRHALRLIPRRLATVGEMLANPNHAEVAPKLCVLLRLTWIAAKKRADLLDFLQKIIIVGRLKMLPPDVQDDGFGGAVDFAWFIFEPYIAGATEIVRAK